MDDIRQDQEPAPAPVATGAPRVDARNPLEDFNRVRNRLVDDFYDLAVLAGNNLFRCNFRNDGHPTAEEIDGQRHLSESERNLLRNICAYARNLAESRFLLGVLGRFKSGKSTLLNCLAQADVSPMDTRVTTGVLNFTLWDPREECKVVYQDGREERISPERKDEFIDHQQNRDNVKRVDRVIFQSPRFELQREIVFVDTPGLDAVNNVHEKITLDFVRQCHAAVIVSSYPSFGQKELEFFEQIKDDIRSVFLIQNLPSDKMVDWIALECQTIENLDKLKFIQLPGSAKRTLEEITAAKDGERLAQLKERYQIRLFSIDGKTAYQGLFAGRNGNGAGDGDAARKLGESRFPLFRDALYRYLGETKAKGLVDEYLLKGRRCLEELANLTKVRREILKKDISDIDKEIERHQKKEREAFEKKDSIFNRFKADATDEFRAFRKIVVNTELAQLTSRLESQYGEANIHRLTKAQKESIRALVEEFNGSFSAHYKRFLDALGNHKKTAEEETRKCLREHCAFAEKPTGRRLPNLDINEMVNVFSIDKILDRAMSVFLVLFTANIAGGEDIRILVWVLGLDPYLSMVIGGVAGLLLSWPAIKYLDPLILPLRGFVSRFVGESVPRAMVPDLQRMVQEALDGIENGVVEVAISSLQKELDKNFADFFAFIEKTLRDMQATSQKGEIEQELARYEVVMNRLGVLSAGFDQIDGRTSGAVEMIKEQAKNVWGKVKKFLPGGRGE